MSTQHVLSPSVPPFPRSPKSSTRIFVSGMHSTAHTSSLPSSTPRHARWVQGWTAQAQAGKGMNMMQLTWVQPPYLTLSRPHNPAPCSPQSGNTTGVDISHPLYWERANRHEVPTFDTHIWLFGNVYSRAEGWRIHRIRDTTTYIYAHSTCILTEKGEEVRFLRCMEPLKGVSHFHEKIGKS